ALYTEGRVSEAMEHYRRASELDPGNPDAHHHMATALRSLGRLLEATAHYRQVLRLDPDREHVKKELADVERQLDLRR
ncbi:MAG: tetratricopeptide repeat protein, partial [Vicinamibacterales bacterium]